MSNRFIITEQERKDILSLYRKKGLIYEQETPTTEGEYFYSPAFQNGQLIIFKKDNKLTYVKTKPNTNEITSKTPINGNHNDFSINLLNGELTNNEFLNNEQLVLNSGRFQSVNSEHRPTFLNGIQLIMIAFNKNKSKDVKLGAPSLCTTQIKVGKVDIFERGKGSSGRQMSESPIINFDQYYTPKNRKEWDQIKENLTNEKEKNTKWSFFRKKLAGIFIEPNWGDSFQGSSPVNPVAPIEINLSVSNPFQFDRTELTGDGNQMLQNFIREIKEIKNLYGDETYRKYINYLKNQRGIKVTTSSSIDGDPNGITADSNNPNATTLPSCNVPNGRPRKVYNKCLSEKRATAIIDILNEQIPDLSGAFVANALGETDQFDPGKKWPDFDSNETQNNRVLEIKLPRFVPR